MRATKAACLYNNFSPLKTVGTWYRERGTVKVWIYVLMCTSSETWNRVIKLVSSECNTLQYEWHWCMLHYIINNKATQTRLINVLTKFMISQLLFKYTTISQWGTVYHHYHGNWDINDATVACRQLGFSKTVGASYFGRGMGKVWLENLFRLRVLTVHTMDRVLFTLGATIIEYSCFTT